MMKKVLTADILVVYLMKFTFNASNRILPFHWLNDSRFLND